MSLGAPVLGRSTLAYERSERPPVDLQRHLDVSHSQDCGHHVDRLGEGVDHAPPALRGGIVGVYDDEGHAVALVQ